jgi:hypothetical protein
MKSYKYILLDWDGNPARTLDLWLDALRKGLEKRGHNFTDLITTEYIFAL